MYASVILAAAPVTSYYEGLKLKAYLDPVGIPTICFGETEGVRMGDVKTKPECDTMLKYRLGYFAWQVDAAVGVPMNVKTHAALASWTYNVGVGAMKKSTLIKKLNAGDYVAACDELLRWNKAGGRVFTGLTKRRAAERKLCLEGVYAY